MNGTLWEALSNPWLASAVSFLPIVVFLGGLFGSFAGPTITADILMSPAIDQFGVETRALNLWRTLGGAPVVAGVVLIAVF